MNQIKALISFLGEGKESSRHAAEIEQNLNKEHGNTQEPTRDLIRDAIVNHKFPIGSTSRDGYFIINNKEELDEVVNGLKKRISGIKERIKSLEFGWKKRKASKKKGGNWPK